MKKIFSYLGRAARFLGLGFLARAVGVLLMLCYVYAGVVALTALVRAEVNARAPVADLARLIDTAHDLSELPAWVRLRPLSDTPALIEVVTPRAGRVGPDLFIELARRQVQLKNTEEGLFWMQLAKYRLRYDILRCGQPGMIEKIDMLLAALAPKDILSLLGEKPELFKVSIRRVLEFDAQYPPTASPDHICQAIARLNEAKVIPVPASEWEWIRNSLRRAAEKFLSQ